MRTTRLVTAGLLVPALLVGINGCSSDKSSSVGGAHVSLKLLAFTPDKLTVKVGTKVTWTDDEAITHTVTSGTPVGIDPQTSLRAGQKPDGKFNAKLNGKGSTFSFTYNTAGTYRYYCSIHLGMNAEVVVTP